MKRFFPILLIGFMTIAHSSENTTLRAEQLFGPNKAKDLSLGADFDLNDETSLSFDYFQSKDDGTSHTYRLGADSDLDSFKSISGEFSYSKDSDNLKGLGLDFGLDLALNELWDQEKSTDLGFSFASTNYSKEEKDGTTTDKTNYYQFRLGIDLEQELISNLYISAGARTYFYKDNSETLTQVTRNRTTSAPFSATDSSTDKKLIAGLRFHPENWPSLSYTFNYISYKDKSKTKENDVTLSYRIKKLKIGIAYQNIKPNDSETEHWIGPKISFKF